MTHGNSYNTFAFHFAANASPTFLNFTNDLSCGGDRLAQALAAVGAASLLPNVSLGNYLELQIGQRSSFSQGGPGKLTTGRSIGIVSIPEKSNRKQPVEFHERLAQYPSIS